MNDSDQPIETAAEVAPQGPSALAAIASDNYSLLLAVGVLVLLVSLVVLAGLWVGRYGLGPKPLIGKVAVASSAQIQVDMGSAKGLKTGDRLLVTRQGTLLARLEVRSVTKDSSTAVLLDAHGESEAGAEGQTPVVTVGDTVIHSPTD